MISVGSDAIEDLIRERFNRPRKSSSYLAEWRLLLAQENLGLSEESLAKLYATPIEISGRPINDVFSRFLSIRGLALKPLLLREVSSRVFWGLSKILDSRTDAVAALLDCEECPFPDPPIILNVHIPSDPASFLFIENHFAFERLKRTNELGNMALIFSSGFRGAAVRLRKSGGCSTYYSRASDPSAMVAFERALFSTLDVPVYFWGDLDYSGMAILTSLRTTFPSAQAWQPGYAPMLCPAKERRRAFCR